MLAPQPRELSGWKEIAAYLGVSVRTAQDYERNLGLPIHRQPGEKGRVFAHPAELDAWRTHTNGNGAPAEPAAADEPYSAPTRKIRRLAYPLIAILTALLLFGIYLLLIPHGPVSDFRVDGKNVIAVNDKGQELWRHTFDAPLADGAYRDEAKLARSWLGDLNGNGGRELLFTVWPANQSEVGTGLLCFAAGGKMKWRFNPGRVVTDGGGNRFVPPYTTNGLHVILGAAPADTRIAVSSNHYLEYPEQVAFLDVKGNVVGEYWHPGHLLHSRTADLDHDGRTELVMAGVNNGNHQATLVVLDPLRIVGLMTPKEMQDHGFELLGMPGAKERAVVFFPRSCISRGQPYTRASFFSITKDRLVVDVAEGAREEDPGFVYELDYALNVVAVTPEGFNVVRAHQALEARGEVDHPFSEECQRLRAGVIVRKK